MTRADRQSGFTLLEVLVAFAILSFTLLAIYRIYAVGFRGADAAQWKRVAVEIAQSRLAAIGTETPLVPGTTGGETVEGFIWQVTISPYRAAAPASVSGGIAPTLFLVEVAVDRAGQRSMSGDAVMLTTVRLVEQP